MSDTLEYLAIFARFPLALRRFRGRRITLDEAKAAIRQALDRREEAFMRIVERCIYGYPRSPYLPLLKNARCELGDLGSLVRQKGLEGALLDLRRAGVYVTYQELKGRKPIVRNGVELEVAGRDFDNPLASRDLAFETGGSTGLANLVGQDVEYAAARAPHRMLGLAVHGALDCPSAYWQPVMPGATLRSLMQRWSFGQSTDHWFSPTGWRESRHWLKYGLGTAYSLAWMRAFGMRAPFPEVVPHEQAVKIARWIGDMLRVYGRCALFASVSRSLRVVMAAEEAGIDLRGAIFRVSGEPATAAKIEPMQRAGVHCIVSYASTETSQIGVGCVCPSSVGDMHLFRDAIALVTYPHRVDGASMTVPAFNLTALIESVPKIALNFQIDDFGIVEERCCGCQLEEIGYTVHLRDVRSYGKLVGEGVTLIAEDMIAIVERELPSRFGGTPLDYQLLEEEDPDGFTRMYLLIHPRLPIADDQTVIEFMLRRLSAASPMADAARLGWQQGETLRIKRIEPIVTARGKQLPLHLQKVLQGNSPGHRSDP